ncbi:MAG: trimeric intracellular cation channel family protein [Sphingomicrobium sp.]
MSPGYIAALGFLDYIGLGVFALSGALLAARKRQDFVTFVFFGVVTGVGGGTARDLLIGAPVFWIHENWILLICLAAALLVWFTPLRWWGGQGLVWADAVGIAVYATYGAAKGLAYGVAPVPAAAMGVLTACLGGIIRDLLAREPSILLRQEYYVTAAALSVGLMVALSSAGVGELASAVIAAGAVFALRAAAIARHWSLPTYGR